MNSDPSTAGRPTRIFLSYARGDDEAFVRRLHADLTTVGFTVWFDRESLMSRGLTFHQEIKDAIRTEVDRVIYVGGPKAAISAYVREEWQFALECDHVVVTPIFRIGKEENVPGELSLLHCEDFRDDANCPGALAKLIASLRQPNPKLGGLFGVPSLPPNFLGRAELMCRMRDALLVDLLKPQVITGADARVGMQGMGGIGKSVLAAALARNRQVRQSYPDGIVWISCGQNLTRDDLLIRQRDLVKHLGGDAGFDSVSQGQGVLRELFSAKAVLLVLDDVWLAADTQAFDVIGPRCRMLITTRDAGILQALKGEPVPVSLFTKAESMQLLADTVGIEQDQLPHEANAIVGECGCLPLAVALCGGMAKAGHSWAEILAALREADLEFAENRGESNEQHRTIWNAMKASYDALPAAEKPRFAELAVFDTDGSVPEAAAQVLWNHACQLSDRNSTKLLIHLAERSLVQLDQKTGADGQFIRRFHFHDLLYDFAVRVTGERQALHQKLLDAYRLKCPDRWHSGPNDGYFFQNLIHHLVETAAWAEAEKVVTDFPWLMRKCELGLLDSISSDYALLNENAETKIRLEIWADFFREKAHILRRGNSEWPAHKILLQLSVEHADDSPLTIAAENWLTTEKCNWIWLRQLRRASHTKENTCHAVFEGHTNWVQGALQLIDGRILSWSWDNTLRLWDAQDGRCLLTFKGHTSWVNGALILNPSQILSWSWDGTLRLWDIGSGQCLSVFTGHSSEVKRALVLNDGRILSWSWDDTLRLWDAKDGRCLLIIKGHKSWVLGALRINGGKILSWSWDGTLRLWDIDSGQCLSVFTGHSSAVMGALVLNDGRILSWSWDKTLRLWDGQDGRCLAVFEGHGGSVQGVLTLCDGNLLSWSEDNTLQLWNTVNGQSFAVLEGHLDKIFGAFGFANGRILSWSKDKTLRLWNGENGQPIAVLNGHTEGVLGATILHDGRILSWSLDKTLRLWDGQDGRCLAVFEGHGGSVQGVMTLCDGNLLSWAADSTLRLWNSKSCSGHKLIEQHSQACRGIVQMSDERILSWSTDCIKLWNAENAKNIASIKPDSDKDWIEGVSAPTDSRILFWSKRGKLRLWDGRSEQCLAVLDGYSDFISGPMAFVDGRILSRSGRNMLRLWDVQNGQSLSSLEGHSQAVNGAIGLKDGRILSWSEDKTLRLWDARNGRCIAVFEGHTDRVCEAIALKNDRRFLSWSWDKTLRLWDTLSGQCLKVLCGHSELVLGALELAHNRILSWSHDSNLRIWDEETGDSLAIFQGHLRSIRGVTCRNEQVLSLSDDNTLRLWDIQNGQCLALLEGHESWINGAIFLKNNQILSWSDDKTMRLWDSESGACIELENFDQVANTHPEWFHEYLKVSKPQTVNGRMFGDTRDLSKKLHHKSISSLFACWQAEFSGGHGCLRDDGTLVLTESNGQACFLKLHHGNRRVSLAEAEIVLNSQMQKMNAP